MIALRIAQLTIRRPNEYRQSLNKLLRPQGLSLLHTHAAARSTRLTQRAVLCFLIIALPLCLLLSVGVGLVPISFGETLRILAHASGFPVAEPNAQQQIILIDIRLPRALLAIVIGACLAVTGVAMQGLFRNPLADPTLIGVAGGASVGAAVAIVTGVTGTTVLLTEHGWSSGFELAAASFIGGLITTLLVYRIATTSFGTSVTTMLLAGIAISALALAFTNTLTYLNEDKYLRRISLWAMGNLSNANWNNLAVASTLIATVVALLPSHSKALNGFLLGEAEARSLGFNVERIKLQLILLTALGIGTAVAFAGLIGFVGLVVPHVMRLSIGPDHRLLIPCSALSGALLLLIADWLARLLAAPVEIPIGIVTALVGAPFFIFLLIQQKYNETMR